MKKKRDSERHRDWKGNVPSRMPCPNNSKGSSPQHRGIRSWVFGNSWEISTAIEMCLFDWEGSGHPYAVKVYCPILTLRESLFPLSFGIFHQSLNKCFFKNLSAFPPSAWARAKPAGGRGGSGPQVPPGLSHNFSSPSGLDWPLSS